MTDQLDLTNPVSPIPETPKEEAPKPTPAPKVRYANVTYLLVQPKPVRGWFLLVEAGKETDLKAYRVVHEKAQRDGFPTKGTMPENEWNSLQRPLDFTEAIAAEMRPASALTLELWRHGIVVNDLLGDESNLFVKLISRFTLSSQALTRIIRQFNANKEH